MPSQCGDHSRCVFAGDLHERGETRMAFPQSRDVVLKSSSALVEFAGAQTAVSNLV
jgi:hypothetical protein